MNGFFTITESILTLGLAMLVGFVCIKTGYIPTEARSALSKLIVKLTLPVLVMTSLTKLELDSTKAVNCLITVVSGFVILGIMFLIGIVTSKLFKMEKPRKVMYQCMSVFGNVVFIAYPLIQELYGAEGLLYAALFAFVNDCYLWTAGIYKISCISGAENSRRKNLKKLVNPSTIAFAVSFIMLVSGLKFGGIVNEVLTGIGSMTTYLSMLVTGGLLAEVDFRSIYKRASLYVLIAVKMIIIPIILIFVLRFLKISEIVRAVLVLQAAMPASTVVSILAAEYKGDSVYCAEAVFITTFISLITLPAVYLVMSAV